MNNFANFCVLIVAILSLMQFFIPLFGKMFNLKTLNYTISFISISCFTLLSISFLTLIFAYINSDFSLLNVWSNSHTSKPLIYKISGSWGNHEGSMLLWILVLCVFNLSSIFLPSSDDFDITFKILSIASSASLISKCVRLFS